MFGTILQTARDKLNSEICTAHFPKNLNSVFNKKIQKIMCVCSITCKKIKNSLNT